MREQLPILRSLALLVAIAAFSAIALLLSQGDWWLIQIKLGAALPPTLCPIVFLAPFVILLFMRELLASRPCASLFAAIRTSRGVIIAFMALVGMSLVGACSSTAFWGEGGKWIFLVSYGFAIFLGTFIAVLLQPVAVAFRPAAIAALLVLFGSMVWDVNHLYVFSGIAGRTGGFAGNPNMGALALNLLCAVVLTYDMRRNLVRDTILLTTTGLGIFMTQSRSGLLCFALLVVYYIAAGFWYGRFGVRGLLFLFLRPALIALSLFLACSYFVGSTESYAVGNLRLSRYMASGSISDDSSETRLQTARDCLKLIEASPIIGYGTGYGRRLSVPPHNMYLQEWLSNGIFGLLAYFSLLITAFLLFVVRRCPQGQGFILVTAVGGLFTHNILEQRPFLMLFGGLLSLTAFQPKRVRQMQMLTAKVQLTASHRLRATEVPDQKADTADRFPMKKSLVTSVAGLRDRILGRLDSDYVKSKELLEAAIQSLTAQVPDTAEGTADRIAYLKGQKAKIVSRLESERRKYCEEFDALLDVFPSAELIDLSCLSLFRLNNGLPAVALFGLGQPAATVSLVSFETDRGYRCKLRLNGEPVCGNGFLEDLPEEFKALAAQIIKATGVELKGAKIRAAAHAKEILLSATLQPAASDKARGVMTRAHRSRAFSRIFMASEVAEWGVRYTALRGRSRIREAVVPTAPPSQIAGHIAREPLIIGLKRVAGEERCFLLNGIATSVLEGWMKDRFGNHDENVHLAMY